MKNVQKHDKKGKITVEKVLEFAKAYEDLKPFFALFIHCFKSILDSEKEIEAIIEEVQRKTRQNFKKDLFFKGLWVLRYMSLYKWFFDLKPPSNQTELADELLVVNSALKSVLKDRNKLDYLLWLEKGFFEYVNVDEFNFSDLKDFRSIFPSKLAERIAYIAFESTEGRLGGELHDYIIELIMSTILKDKKVFELSDNLSLTEEETQNIKSVITEMKPTENDLKDFIDSISGV